MKLRSILIDDEFLARKRLEKLVADFDKITIIAQCRNGADAIEQINLKEPDLIFLDIQMPDFDGFTVLSKLTCKPAVIFTTAFDSFAIKAFDINAVDYLLKPFDEERLGLAINRIIEQKKLQKATLLEGQIKKLLNDYTNQQDGTLKEIIIKNKGKEVPVFIDDILYFKSDGNYVDIITSEKKHLYRISMNELEKTLDNDQFLRVHRSIILNKYYIKNCTYTGNNEYVFLLKNGEKITSSRSYKTAIIAYLNTI